MKLSADEALALREAVRDHLERTPAFRPLAPDRRSELAGDMVAVLDTRIAAVEPASASGLLAAVDFPAFVAGLVGGTFEATVDGSIRQMEAYAALVRAVARGVGDGSDVRIVRPTRPDRDRPDIDLPDLDAGGAAPVPENIRSVAAVYFAHELEQLRLFAVVDRILDLFRAGQLPLGHGQKELAEFALRRDRLTPEERASCFDRVLCTDGAEAIWRQFLVAVQAAVAGAPDDPRPSPLLAPVRSAGQALARLASDHGLGATGALAPALVDDARRCFALLDLPDVQAAFAVRDRWALIERVASTYLGGAPDSVGRRTRASAGVVILEWLADRARSLAAGPLALAAIAEPVARWLSVPTPDPPRARRVLPKKRGA